MKLFNRPGRSVLFFFLMLLAGFATAEPTPPPKVVEAAPTLASIAKDDPQPPLAQPVLSPGSSYSVPALGAFQGPAGNLNTPPAHYVLSIRSGRNGQLEADIVDSGAEAHVRVGDIAPSGGTVVAIQTHRVDVKAKGGKTTYFFMRPANVGTGMGR